MKTRLRSHFIVCIAIGAIVGCDGDGVESAEGRQVGALGSVTTLGSSGPYTGGLASSSAINPSGLGSSPWAPDASVSDCSDACGMLFLCFPDETDDLDDCLAGCAAAIEDGDAVAATSIGCVARSPTCAAAAQCLEEAYGDSPGDALGNGLGVP
ncbi:MAG: hypothetical protein VX938_07065, partial [Myxococcota bacterium]|nr:hypothetical protein [Myxococcota bacterium]